MKLKVKGTVRLVSAIRLRRRRGRPRHRYGQVRRRSVLYPRRLQDRHHRREHRAKQSFPRSGLPTAIGGMRKRLSWS
nr:hypothetical protein SHINE37_42683 [Rhizobiaceae bacterium]